MAWTRPHLMMMILPVFLFQTMGLSYLFDQTHRHVWIYSHSEFITVINQPSEHDRLTWWNKSTWTWSTNRMKGVALLPLMCRSKLLLQYFMNHFFIYILMPINQVFGLKVTQLMSHSRKDGDTQLETNKYRQVVKWFQLTWKKTLKCFKRYFPFSLLTTQWELILP